MLRPLLLLLLAAAAAVVATVLLRAALLRRADARSRRAYELPRARRSTSAPAVGAGLSAVTAAAVVTLLVTGAGTARTGVDTPPPRAGGTAAEDADLARPSAAGRGQPAPLVHRGADDNPPRHPSTRPPSTRPPSPHPPAAGRKATSRQAAPRFRPAGAGPGGGRLEAATVGTLPVRVWLPRQYGRRALPAVLVIADGAAGAAGRLPAQLYEGFAQRAAAGEADPFVVVGVGAGRGGRRCPDAAALGEVARAVRGRYRVRAEPSGWGVLGRAEQAGCALRNALGGARGSTGGFGGAAVAVSLHRTVRATPVPTRTRRTHSPRHPRYPRHPHLSRPSGTGGTPAPPAPSRASSTARPSRSAPRPAARPTGSAPRAAVSAHRSAGHSRSSTDDAAEAAAPRRPTASPPRTVPARTLRPRAARPRIARLPILLVCTSRDAPARRVGRATAGALSGRAAVRLIDTVRDFDRSREQTRLFGVAAHYLTQQLATR